MCCRPQTWKRKRESTNIESVICAFLIEKSRPSFFFPQRWKCERSVVEEGSCRFRLARRFCHDDWRWKRHVTKFKFESQFWKVMLSKQKKYLYFSIFPILIILHIQYLMLFFLSFSHKYWLQVFCSLVGNIFFSLT